MVLFTTVFCYTLLYVVVDCFGELLNAGLECGSLEQYSSEKSVVLHETKGRETAKNRLWLGLSAKDPARASTVDSRPTLATRLAVLGEGIEYIFSTQHYSTFTTVYCRCR